jgi:DMSO/TMAO reductase YedYZ molybdopterin-dependent catalytic subunit
MSTKTQRDPARLELAARTRRAFLTGGLAAAAAAAGFRWIAGGRSDNGIPAPLRRSLEWQERLTQAYFRPTPLVREFPLEAAGIPRANGDVGLDGEPSDAWRLQVNGVATGDGKASVGMSDLRALPKVEFVTELKCVEGWSRPVRWGGARLLDFAQRYRPAIGGADSYMGLRTPDGEYYVGIDMPSAVHPQTLLCYEMDGSPLTAEHGAPLRLVIPIKYGIKNLKRIGEIAFTQTRPPDYWAERGYDYYSGF